MALIILSFVSVIFLYVKIRGCLYRRRVYGASRELYLQVKDDLKGIGRNLAGISEDEILSKYLGGGGGDQKGGIARNQKTFKKEILP